MSLSELPSLRLQFHTLTALPAHNVNRDEDGRPKTIQYGGSLRGRISSQAKKRWIRFSHLISEDQRAVRTREAGILTFRRLIGDGQEPDIDLALAAWAALAANRAIGGGGDAPKLETAQALVGGNKSKRKQKGGDAAEGINFDDANLRTEQGLVVSRAELEALKTWTDDLRRALLADRERAEATAGAAIDQITKHGFLSQERIDLDIALFGRMVATNPKVNTEAAASVGHAMTTHAFAVEGDYFSAGEELNVLNETGAAITSYAFYGSGVYYQHATLDVGHLGRTLHDDGGYDLDRTRALVLDGVRVMLDGLVQVQPRGKRNSFASDTMASFALVEAGAGPTFNLALAFLDPVRPGERTTDGAAFSYTPRDVLTVSIERLRNLYDTARSAYSLAHSACVFAGPGAPRVGNKPPEPRDGVGEVWTLHDLHDWAVREISRWWTLA